MPSLAWRFARGLAGAAALLSTELLAQTGATPDDGTPTWLWGTLMIVVAIVSFLYWWGSRSRIKEKYGPSSESITKTPASKRAPERVAQRVAERVSERQSPPPVTVERAEKLPIEPKSAGKSIFISYRRQDSAHITGRLYDTLIARFGKSTIFKDVDSIPLGRDFREHIREQVGRCDVLVVVIGRSWSGPLATGGRRLDDPRDHLRIEIETAMERKIPVIPVLVDGVEMPVEVELPASIGRLAYHNGISVRPDPDFHNDAERLARGIESLLK